MDPLVIPGAVALLTVFYPKTTNPLFQAGRVFSGGLAALGLSVVAYKKFQVALLLCSLPGSIGGVVGIVGAAKLCKEIMAFYRAQQEYQQINQNERND